MIISLLRIVGILSVTSIILTACGNAKNKLDTAAGRIATDTMEKIVPEKNSEPTTSSNNNKKTERENILANIDKYLVCEARFDLPPATGGIVNGMVTVKNMLADISIQRATVEVTILLADNKEFRSDYYNVINIGPGEFKIIKLPTTSRGHKVVAHIVKLKSDTLTNSEMLLVGNHYVPG